MFLGGGESPEKLEQNVHFTSENDLQQQEEHGNMPTSPSSKPILEGTLIYRKDGRRLKTKNIRTVSYMAFCLYTHIIYNVYLFVFLTMYIFILQQTYNAVLRI